VQTDLAKKEKKKKEIVEKGSDVSVMIYRGEINLYVSSRVMLFIMSCKVVRLSRNSLANLCTAILRHAERLQDLLGPSWPNAEEIQDKISSLVYPHA
jgi:hypothetical protein